ncbi:MAG: hypothetical protein HYY24_17560 [Verrucomicrobia bacterium]|nr:hypothetical protein [Verrucomicrobiota bacterium]
MRLVILHSHFRPGGVRRVIELATPHLVAHWPEKIRTVVLAGGELPAPAWLQAFRERLRGTTVRVHVEPAFGYVSEWGREIQRNEQLRQEWAQTNYALGVKYLSYAAARRKLAVSAACSRGSASDSGVTPGGPHRKERKEGLPAGMGIR